MIATVVCPANGIVQLVPVDHQINTYTNDTLPALMTLSINVTWVMCRRLSLCLWVLFLVAHRIHNPYKVVLVKQRADHTKQYAYPFIGGRIIYGNMFQLAGLVHLRCVEIFSTHKLRIYWPQQNGFISLLMTCASDAVMSDRKGKGVAVTPRYFTFVVWSVSTAIACECINQAWPLETYDRIKYFKS